MKMEQFEQFESNNNFKLLLPLTYGIGAALAITANNPFSVLRFRLQTMPQLLRQGQLTKPYDGLIDCAKRIFKQQRITGFWKGNLSVLCRFYPSELFNFFLKQSFSKIFNSSIYTKNYPQFLLNTLSGISSGFVTITILYPLDYARLKLTNNIKGKNKKLFNAIYNTFKLQGFQGIYRGVFLSYFAMIIFRGSFFGLYDTFKVQTKNKFQKFYLSYLATINAMLFVSPLQTVIRRMMMTSGHSFKYRGYTDCISQIYQKQKIKGFFRGACMIPFQSITVGLMFTLFDNIFSQFKNVQDIPN